MPKEKKKKKAKSFSEKVREAMSIFARFHPASAAGERSMKDKGIPAAKRAAKEAKRARR